LDRRNGCLLLSRDRFGEKPLYVWQSDHTLYFASEIKALAALSGRRPSVDTAHLRRYLVNGFRSLYKEPATYFAGVRELPPATFAILRNSHDIEPRIYWQ